MLFEKMQSSNISLGSEAANSAKPSHRLLDLILEGWQLEAWFHGSQRETDDSSFGSNVSFKIYLLYCQQQLDTVVQRARTILVLFVGTPMGRKPGNHSWVSILHFEANPVLVSCHWVQKATSSRSPSTLSGFSPAKFVLRTPQHVTTSRLPNE